MTLPSPSPAPAPRPRHARQARLAEVGPEGQARIARAVVDVPGGGLAALVTARYLAGAGVGALRVRDTAAGDAARAVDASVRIEVEPSLAASGAEAPAAIHDPVARELAAGALAALAALRAALAAAP